MLVDDTVDVIKRVLQEVEDNRLISDYERYKDRIKELLVDALRREERLTHVMAGKIDKTTTTEIGQEMKDILGRDRVNSIEKSFAIETYTIELVKDKGQSVARVQRGGKAIEPDITLSTIESIEKAIERQWESFLLELFLFLLSCVGISVDLSKSYIKDIVQVLTPKIAKVSAFKTALHKCVEAWNKEGCDVWGKAKVIFYFMKECYLLGIFWKIIKLFFKDTSKWEKISVIVEVSLMLVTAFAFDWLALLAKLALAVDWGGYLAGKIENLVKLFDRRKALQKTKKY